MRLHQLLLLFAPDVVLTLAVTLIFIQSMRTEALFRATVAKDDWIICHLAGRVADLATDEDEKRQATELFRHFKKRILARGEE